MPTTPVRCTTRVDRVSAVDSTMRKRVSGRTGYVLSQRMPRHTTGDVHLPSIKFVSCDNCPIREKRERSPLRSNRWISASIPNKPHWKSSAHSKVFIHVPSTWWSPFPCPTRINSHVLFNSCKMTGWFVRPTMIDASTILRSLVWSATWPFPNNPWKALFPWRLNRNGHCWKAILRYRALWNSTIN